VTSPPQEQEPEDSGESRRPLPWREFLAGVVFLASAVGLVAVLRAGPPAGQVQLSTIGEAPPPVGQVKTWLNLPTGAAPAWRGEDQIEFSALRGKVVVLEFWSAWCHQCRGANLELNALHDQGRKDLQVIGVTMRDRYVEEPEILAHVREQIRFPVALLGQGSAITSYQVRQIPHSVIISREGTVSWQGKGGTKAFSAALAQALGEAPK
jgi:thiol-disulfide isomerase/thioredoxin